MTIDGLPPPPVPADCDLRGMPGFMLDTERLMASELWALSDGTAFKAAMALWCRSWRQVPAASLPDDDATLRAFAGLTPAAWKKARDLALRGFVKCSDGRLYHKVLAEDAARAWGHRQQQRARANKRWAGNATASQPDDAEAMPRHESGNSAALPMQSQGQGQGQGQQDAAGAASSRERAAPPPADMFDGIQEPPALRIAERPKNMGDFQAMHPRIYVGRDERGAWEATLAEFGWDLMRHAYRTLEPTVPRGNRVLLSMITGWLGENTKPKDTP